MENTIIWKMKGYGKYNNMENEMIWNIQ